MINVKEFRIGNFLLADQSIQRVCLINNDTGPEANPGIGYEFEGDCRYEDQCSPKLAAVPLSDALLQLLGFRFHPYFKLWQRTRLDGSYSIELDHDYTALDFSHRPIVKNIKYLHILQNLFFIVQGEELVEDSHSGLTELHSADGLKQYFVSDN